MNKLVKIMLLTSISLNACASDEQPAATVSSSDSTMQPKQSQTVVEQMTLNGQPIEALSVNGKGFPFADVQHWFETFKTSPEFPKFETKDYTKTPWGYEGSSSTLRAFYSYLAKQDNHGWHVDPPEIQVPPPPIESKP